MSCDAWPVVWPCDPPAGSTDDQMDAALSAAQALLWSLTGRRLGLCTVTEWYRPAGGGVCGVPYMTDDRVWHNAGRSGAVCCAINLVSLPVNAVTTVKVNTVVLDASGYRLERPDRLVRYGACWPSGDWCAAPPVEVTYVTGVSLAAVVGPVPPDEPGSAAAPLWGLAASAMGEIANEMLIGMCGGACRLPSRAVTVSRQGVTVEMASPSENAEAGLLGMPMADALIRAVNPGRLRARSRVYSPDMAQVSR